MQHQQHQQQNPLALQPAPRAPDDLAAHACLIYSSVQGDDRWTLLPPGGAEVAVPVRGRLRSNNLSALLAAARAGMGLAVLATVGSTAPFVGLFGTVWGIYHALSAIGISGQASIDKVAGPVGEALIMTAFGLAVAVPAVMGYNWLIRRNKMITEKLRAFAGDLQAYLISKSK